MTPKNYPVISVVTVVFNGASDLPCTLASVSSQTYKHIEYIVIDGDSTDGTKEIVEKNRSTVHTFVSEKDAGLYDAMNKGKAMATGDFVIFLNAGDIFYAETTIETIVSRITARNKLYYCYVEIISLADKWRLPKLGVSSIAGYSSLPHHQSILYPKHYYKFNDYNLKYKVQSDVDYTSRAVRQLESEFINEVLIVSVLGGFSKRIYSSWSQVTEYSSEVVSIYRENVAPSSAVYVVGIYFKNFIKYAATKFGGHNLLFWITKMAARYK
jgi:glycosyltransferase involved in cell wall biosynthesis